MRGVYSTMKNSNDMRVINFVGLKKAKEQYSEKKYTTRYIALTIAILICLISWVIYK